MIRVGAVLHCVPYLTCFTPTVIKRRRFGALDSTICGCPAVPTGTIRSNLHAAAESLSCCLRRSVPACYKSVKEQFLLLYYLIRFSLSRRVLQQIC